MGLFVLRVSATDKDLGTNARITYTLEGNSAGIVINLLFGALIMIKGLKTKWTSITAAKTTVDHGELPAPQKI